ncbi:MAG TPA: DPP IV N-terminal domain-containing protein [Bacteroidales bacterium]|nr:prolyl oligopeptidase family serine peptidase [Bacteroidales bacterium]HNR42288.1 DPP IV N-terminal domain-containing protein [Bacteroidales bacterium]
MKANISSGFLIVFISAILSSMAFAQTGMQPRGANQVRVTGWKDDNHYLIQAYDEQRNLVLKSVDIRTGTAVEVQPERTAREVLSGLLPEGTMLGYGDPVSSDGRSAIITKDNDLFYFNIDDRKLRRLTNDSRQEVNPRFSDDGKRIAYTRNRDLYVYDLENGIETRLTHDASERIYNGYASWVYMEEILGRQSNYAAFWFSPDGRKIAYLRTDETDVPVFTLNRLDEPDGIHGVLEQVPYPKAGDPNPRVKMGIADISTGKTTWVKTDETIDQYIAWPFWSPDSKSLAIQILNRDQNEIKIILASPLTGEFWEIYRETSETWVEFFEDVYVMKNGTGFILRSFMTGWENLYYYDWNGSLLSRITAFNWRVNRIERVDEAAKVLYFYGTGPESTDNHFYRTGLDGKNLLQVSKGAGTHDVSVSPGGSWFIDTWNNIASPGGIIAYDRRGRLLREIHRFDNPEPDPSKNSRADLIRIRTSDGLFDMPAIITYPLNFDETRQYPVIFTIYGGPDSKNISSNRWQGNTPSWYAQNGIITFTVDHRGSGHFGRRGLNYLHRSLGKWEILDYEDAVKWLLQKPYVDPARMGITGSSYGGYMTCLALTRGADYWTHGFAGSSVTDFRLYDNIYTERYMDTPADNPDGYREGSALTWAANYKGKLYMTHGDMDDNVHMQNSIYLISKLQDEGKTFQFMLYPDGRHGWGGKKSLHSRSEANNFWLSSFFEGR